MAIEITKRINGGFTIEIDALLPIYVSELGYYSSPAGVRLLLPGKAGTIHPVAWVPADWTIQGVTGFVTVLAVVDALDVLGLSNADVLDDMKALLTSIDADTANLLPINAAMTSGNQKTQIVNPGGVNLFASTPIREISATLTRPVDNANYAAGDHISAAVANVKKKVTVTLTGSAPVKQKDTVTLTGDSGTATITGTEGLNKLVTFLVDLTTSAAAFVTDFAADYAPDVIVTSAGEDIIFEAAVAGTPFVSPIITNLTPNLAGTVVNTTANVLVGQAEFSAAGGLTKTATFATSLTQTATNFAAANAADYLATGIVLTSLNADVIFEANVAGVTFTTPVVTTTVGDLAGTVVLTTPNVTLVPVLLDDMSVDLGEGGIIMDVVVSTTITQLAGQTLRIWLFNETPLGIVGDNVAFTNLITNGHERVGSGYVDVPLNALLTGSDSIVGVASPAVSFKCAAADTTVYALVQTLGAATAPTSAGVIIMKFTVINLTK